MGDNLAIAAIVLGSCATAVLGSGESDTVFSGPQMGEKLPALNVTLAYGTEARQTIDLVERAAGRPSLLVIVNGSISCRRFVRGGETITGCGELVAGGASRWCLG